MLDFIKEDKSVWELLEQTDKPLVLYGMGNGGDKILDRLEAVGKRVSGVFASDEFVRGQQFHGYTVRKYADLLAELGDFVVVIAFASELPEVLERFYDLAQKHQTYAPHVPVFPGEEVVSREWLQRYEHQLQQVYDRLADEESRAVFAGALNYKLSGKISYLQAVTTDRYHDLQSLLPLGTDEVYADLGAYNGDTLLEFNRLSEGRYKAMLAVEPDPKNFKKLCCRGALLVKEGNADLVLEKNLEEAAIAEGAQRALATGEAYQVGRITCVPKGIWKEQAVLEFAASGGRQASLETAGVTKKLMALQVDGLDNMVAAAGLGQTTYIKMDVEGVEAQALAGAAKQLRGRPKLMIAAYHHDEDLFKLPLLIWQLQPNYKIYLRKHPYVPAWELNFFAR